jgi:hypothetical protein
VAADYADDRRIGQYLGRLGDTKRGGLRRRRVVDQLPRVRDPASVHGRQRRLATQRPALAWPQWHFLRDDLGRGSAAGSNGYGTVFSISHGGTFAVVHAFKNGRDGAHPTGGLAQPADGRIFGGTQSGTIFAITP